MSVEPRRVEANRPRSGEGRLPRRSNSPSVSFAKLPARRAWLHLTRRKGKGSFSDLEAYVGLALFVDSKKRLPGQREAARLWNWGRARAKTFLENEKVWFPWLQGDGRSAAHAARPATRSTTLKANNTKVNRAYMEEGRTSYKTAEPDAPGSTNTNEDKSNQQSQGPSDRMRRGEEAYQRARVDLVGVYGPSIVSQWFDVCRKELVDLGHLQLEPNPLAFDWIRRNLGLVHEVAKYKVEFVLRVAEEHVSSQRTSPEQPSVGCTREAGSGWNN